MLSCRKVLWGAVLLIACERVGHGHDEAVQSESLAEALSGRVGLIVGMVRGSDDASTATVAFEGFFARHNGISATAALDALDARAVADVLSHRPGACWRDAGRATGRGEIQLLEAGALSVEGAARVSLDGKAVPALLDRISGTLYRTGRDVPIRADRELRIKATGGSAFGPIDVRLNVPGTLRMVAHAETSNELVIGWNRGDAGDSVVISVRTGDSTLRCVTADDGVFRVGAETMAALAGKSIRVTATRVRLSAFSATGLQSAYAAILVEEELNLNRGQ